MQDSIQKRGRPKVDEPRLPRSKRTMVRKRAAVACEECRVLKRRCDGAYPACGGCMKRMVMCVYSSELQAREWNRSMIQSLRTRLEELEKAEQTLPLVERHILPLDNCTTTRPPVQSSQAMSSPFTVEAQDSGSSGLSKPAGNSSCAGSSIVSDTAPCTGEDELVNESVTFGQSRVVDIGTPSGCIQPCSFEKLMKPIDLALNRSGDAATPVLVLNSGSLQTETPVSQIMETCCTCDRSLNAMRWCLPLRRRADSLVAIFFSRHNRMFPILHLPTFMRQYAALWESKESLTETQKTNCSGLCRQKSRGRLFPAMVYTVLSLGALFASRSPEQNAIQAAPFFLQAQGIDFFDTLDKEVGIELVQLGLLMGLYLQSTEKFSKCWNVSGLTMRMAQNMGLHLSIAEACKRGLIESFPTQLECEMRRRVWYGCVLLETELSMSFGQPLMIPASGKGIKLPEAIDDDRLSDVGGKLNLQPKNQPSLLEYYIQTIKLYNILGSVLDREELNTGTSSESTPNTRAILRLDTQIMEWREILPSYLKYDPLPEENLPPEAIVSDEFMKSHEILDLPALSKRLYCRFLHTRQLILRPALELLFEKQHRNKPASKKSMEERLQDAMLSDIALQCVLSAKSLVDFLAVQIQSQNFTCWWYNISYLHTSGSTILMGRLSNLDNSSLLNVSLSSSWDLCLQYLSRYSEMSTIAKKSSLLLQEGAKRLLLKNHQQTGTRFTSDEFLSLATQELQGQDSSISDKSMHPINDLIENPLDRDSYCLPSKIYPGLDVFLETDLDEDYLKILGSEYWINEPPGTSSWPFMPFISQLETFPTTFEASNIVY